MAGDLLLNLLASLIFFALGYLFDRFLEWRSLQVVRNLWRPFLKQTPLVVSFTTRPGPKARSTRRVSFTEMEAFVRISQTMAKLGLESQAKDSQMTPSEFKGSNLVLLGSPLSNQATDSIWQALAIHLPYQFIDPPENPGEYYLQSPGQAYIPEYNQDSILSKDYAVLIRTANPFDYDKAVIIAAGTHGYGTFGAILLLTQKIYSRTFARLTKGRDFIALLEIQLASQQVINIRVLECQILIPEHH
jgi:hypothetical protein